VLFSLFVVRRRTLAYFFLPPRRSRIFLVFFPKTREKSRNLPLNPEAPKNRKRSKIFPHQEKEAENLFFKRKIYPRKTSYSALKIKHTNIKNMSAIAQITNRCVSVASVSRKTQTKRVAVPVRERCREAFFSFFFD